ncbi:MAG: 30S ribosomal protein S1 [Chitinophagales bacterium]|nr:30S ribosomal protein S1 [Chitinophagales bacterium]MDW8428174.1 30S ribosomal protein S1 [Chitinophagales bacterium]
MEETKNEPTSSTAEITAQPTTAQREAQQSDDFDWESKKLVTRKYSEEERKRWEELYGESFVTVHDNEIVKGTVVSISDSDVVLNIGFKSDGMVPLSEFRDMENLKVGDVVEVMVVEKENVKGQLILSRKNAKLERAWERIVEAHNNGEVVTGLITSKTKGGLIVDLFGMETFLPGSQIDIKPITDYDQFLNKLMEFKVVKINPQIKNAVVSHKALIESDLEQQRMQIISRLERGQVLEGTVKNITDFGAFIDLGGVDGLLYITDISWGRISHPSEVLQLNQKINVVVLDFDDEKKRISLGRKQLEPHPWDTLSDEYRVGVKVKGKIVNIEDYGAFLEVVPGVEGLIHVSEISWSNTPINAKEHFKLGDEVEALIIHLDRAERKMSLSIKQLTPDPWADIEKKYPVGTRLTGKVRSIVNHGVFVTLEEGITGYVHISDLSWLKRIQHPNEVTKVGEDLEVVVLEINKEERKITLGHKQIEEDPWDTFETIFPVGSEHQATVIKKEDKWATVLLPYGMEAVCPIKHLKKSNGKLAEVDETLTFKVIEFERAQRRITVSHLRYWQDLKEAEKQAQKEKQRDERKQQRQELKKLSSKVEKSTLGELSALKEIKFKIETSGKAQKETKESKKDQGAKEALETEQSKDKKKTEPPAMEASAGAAGPSAENPPAADTTPTSEHSDQTSEAPPPSAEEQQPPPQQ